MYTHDVYMAALLRKQQVCCCYNSVLARRPNKHTAELVSHQRVTRELEIIDSTFIK